jgi:hypothetical protein
MCPYACLSVSMSGYARSVCLCCPMSVATSRCCNRDSCQRPYLSAKFATPTLMAPMRYQRPSVLKQWDSCQHLKSSRMRASIGPFILVRSPFIIIAAVPGGRVYRGLPAPAGGALRSAQGVRLPNQMALDRAESITGIDGIELVLLGMHNRTLRPCLPAIAISENIIAVEYETRLRSPWLLV